MTTAERIEVTFGSAFGDKQPRPPAVYVKNKDGRLYWCNSHGRRATHLLVRQGMEDHRCCAPGSSGILLPCSTVDLTDLCEMTDDGKPRRRGDWDSLEMNP